MAYECHTQIRIIIIKKEPKQGLKGTMRKRESLLS